MARAVLIFGRTPAAEVATKNLRPRAERIFQAVVSSWIATAARCNAELIVACEPHHRKTFAGLGASRFIDQHGQTFGERLASAASAAFGLGFESILITGIDAPPPAVSPLRASFERTAGAIAPSLDGGVNFLIVRPADIPLLRSFSVGDPSLAQRCRNWFGGALVEFAPATDIDSPESLAVALRQPAWRGYRFIAEPRGECSRGSFFFDTPDSAGGNFLRAPPVAISPAA